MVKRIENITEFFESTIEGLPYANKFALVLDPDLFLNLGEKYIDTTNGRTWNVIRYSGNDFEVRKRYSSMETDGSLILWVTPTHQKDPLFRINLSFLYDIVDRAESVIDLSLKKVLNDWMQNVEWPAALFEYPQEIGANLSELRLLYSALRKEVPNLIPLNANHVKAIILTLRHKNMKVNEILFGGFSKQHAYLKYISVLLRYELDQNDRLTLNEIFESEFNNSGNKPFLLNVSRIELAKFLYVLPFVHKYFSGDSLLQIKGLGFLDFDPEAVREIDIGMIIKELESNSNLKIIVNRLAEDNLDPLEATNLTLSRNSVKLQNMVDVISKETKPLIVCSLVANFLKDLLAKKEMKSERLCWTENLSIPQIEAETSTRYSEYSKKMIICLKNLYVIFRSLECDYQQKTQLSSLLDWWKTSGMFSIQLTLAETINNVQCIVDLELRKSFKLYLENLKHDVHRRLEKADMNLASIIEKNWADYLSHPLLSTNILHDYITSRKTSFLREKKIWFLIFDGMRLETWNSIVKPALFSIFEVKEEKLYVSMLPSKTDIARVSLIAGATPDKWAGYDGEFTPDHFILAPKAFGLNRLEAREQFNLTVACETDISQTRLDENSRRYNILVYNLSDDWIHEFRGDIQELNNVIEGTIKRTVIPDLEKRIGPDDYVVLSSDHGFIELFRDEEIKISDPAFSSDYKKKTIAYRYLLNIRDHHGYQVNLRGDFYIVAEGRKWFSRFKGRPARYAHGGISLDEMVVPAVILQRVVNPIIELFLGAPIAIDLLEDQPSYVEFKIENKGNKPTSYTIELKIDTQEDKQFNTINPNEFQVIKFGISKPTISMKVLEVELITKVSETQVKKQKRAVPVNVKKRTDKVELQFGGLDKLMSDDE